MARTKQTARKSSQPDRAAVEAAFRFNAVRERIHLLATEDVDEPGDGAVLLVLLRHFEVDPAAVVAGLQSWDISRSIEVLPVLMFGLDDMQEQHDAEPTRATDEELGLALSGFSHWDDDDKAVGVLLGLRAGGMFVRVMELTKYMEHWSAERAVSLLDCWWTGSTGEEIPRPALGLGTRTWSDDDRIADFCDTAAAHGWGEDEDDLSFSEQGSDFGSPE